MYSWTKDEYLAVIADQSIYDKVADIFDVPSNSKVNVDDDDDLAELGEDEKKKYLVGLKFYYAGGSCRYMFQYPTDKVQIELETGIKFVDGKSELVTYCSWSLNNHLIDELYGLQYDGLNDVRLPVSSYVVFRFAEVCDEGAIVKLTKLCSALNNPALAGYLLEWLFLSSVARREVKLFGHGGVINVLPRAGVGRLDPKRSFRPTNENSAFDGVISCCNPDGTFNIDFDDGEKSTTVNGELIQMHDSAKRGNRLEVGDKVKAKQNLRIGGIRRWLQPVVWNQGGYAAVYFDVDNREVVFVEVARSESHAFKMTHLNEVILKLKAAGKCISKVVVYVVIKPTQCVEDIKFSSIEDRGLLVNSIRVGQVQKNIT